MYSELKNERNVSTRFDSIIKIYISLLLFKSNIENMKRKEKKSICFRFSQVT